MNHNIYKEKWYGTTVVSVRKGSEVVIAADGQVTLGDTVMKANARKVRTWRWKSNNWICWSNS